MKRRAFAKAGSGTTKHKMKTCEKTKQNKTKRCCVSFDHVMLKRCNALTQVDELLRLLGRERLPRAPLGRQAWPGDLGLPDTAGIFQIRKTERGVFESLIAMRLPFIGQNRSIFTGNLGLFWIYFYRRTTYAYTYSSYSTMHSRSITCASGMRTMITLPR